MQGPKHGSLTHEDLAVRLHGLSDILEDQHTFLVGPVMAVWLINT